MLEALKEKFVWIGLAIIAVLGYIFTLQKKNDNLKSDLEKSNSDRELEKINTKVEEARKDANNAQEDYETLRAKYLADHVNDTNS